MLGEVVRLQRLPLAELLAAPVAAQPAGALAGAGLGVLLAGRAVAGRHGAVPLQQHVRRPRRRAAHAAGPHGAAVGQAVASPRGAGGARAERADERRHDAAHAVGPPVGVVRGGPDGAEPPAATEAGDLELAAGVGAEHDLVRDGVEELAAADGPRAAAGRLPRVALAPVDDVPQVGDGAGAPRPRGGALGDDRRQVPGARGGAGGLGPRHVDLRRLRAAVQRPLEREPHRRRRWPLPRRRRGLLLLRSPRDATSGAGGGSGSSGAPAPPPLAHRVRVALARSVTALPAAGRRHPSPTRGSEAGGGN
jgi:hypothetical protein